MATTAAGVDLMRDTKGALRRRIQVSLVVCQRLGNPERCYLHLHTQYGFASGFPPDDVPADIGDRIATAQERYARRRSGQKAPDTSQ
ncbi:MAG: hypothetical protein U0667_14300 [Chloroflexota bacterium]